MDSPDLPPIGENNVWFHFAQTDTVVVFVHGVLSDSRSCWFYQDRADPSRSEYWPKLVRSDRRLGNPSIFLGGYYTAIDAGPYDIRNCADELHDALNRPDVEGRPTVLEHKRLLFVCHSTGGIVVRYLLDKHYARFEHKDVGLVLIASPSYGSALADRLKLLARLYKHKLGRQLQWGNWSLQDLDTRFKDLVHQRRIPNLSGVEAYENHFIVHRKWLPPQTFVVDEHSAGRYFGAPRLLRQTDHFSAVKPDSVRHPAHELLVDFVTNEYRPAVQVLRTEAPQHDGQRATSQPKARKSTESDTGAERLSQEYRVLATLHRGHYSAVRHCVSLRTGESCVVKQTLASMVSLPALHALQQAALSGVVTPNRIWEEDGSVWEELPFVDGISLSKSVPRGIGGLRGSILQSCHQSLMETLRGLHEVGLIHRDIHADNVFLVIAPSEARWDSERLEEQSRRKHWEHLARRPKEPPEPEALRTAMNFTSRWVLADTTTVALISEGPSRPTVVHGTATPPEQALGHPMPASDIYSLGATLYYGINGRELPSATQRKEDADFLPWVSEIGQAIHPSVKFSQHLASMLSLQPEDRPQPDCELSNDTIAPVYCGALQLSNEMFLLSNLEGSYTHIVNSQQLSRFLHRSASERSTYWSALASRLNITPSAIS